MSGPPPEGAPPRHDLPWLRHRSLRIALSAGTGASLGEPPATALSDYFAGRATHHRSGQPDVAIPSPLSPPLSPPTPTPTPTLDLAEPPRSPAPGQDTSTSAPAPASSLLDLSASDPAGRTRSVEARQTVPRPVRRAVLRVQQGSRTILTARDPTVTLNRIQCGVGTLTLEAVCSAAVGDIRIGALYQLSSGTSSLVSLARGIPRAPADSHRPVVTGQRNEYDRLVVDLRQSRSLARLLVYAFSDSGTQLDWGGTLVGSTFGGARVELPLDVGAHLGPIALLSVYNIDGEYVVRAEMEKIEGPIHEVARRYGYDRITWADESMPVL